MTSKVAAEAPAKDQKQETPRTGLKEFLVHHGAEATLAAGEVFTQLFSAANNGGLQAVMTLLQEKAGEMAHYVTEHKDEVKQKTEDIGKKVNDALKRKKKKAGVDHTWQLLAPALQKLAENVEENGPKLAANGSDMVKNGKSAVASFLEDKPDLQKSWTELQAAAKAVAKALAELFQEEDTEALLSGPGPEISVIPAAATTKPKPPQAEASGAEKNVNIKEVKKAEKEAKKDGDQE